MTFKSILVHVSPAERDANRLRAAADLARRFEATLIGLGAEGIAPLVASGDAWGVAASQWAIDAGAAIASDLQAAERLFQQVAEGQPSLWRQERGAPSDVLIANAALADLIVIGPDVAREIDALRSPDGGQVVIGAGRPVLQAPAARTHLSGEHVVVAWKDSREARRAVADALPLLQWANDVVLTVVEPRSMKDVAVGSAEEAATMLRRHDVPVRVAWMEGGGGDVAEALQEKARRIGSDLIVAGGYGHSRLGEWAFGGVTRALLQQDDLFVLFSH